MTHAITTQVTAEGMAGGWDRAIRACPRAGRLRVDQPEASTARIYETHDDTWDLIGSPDSESESESGSDAAAAGLLTTECALELAGPGPSATRDGTLVL